MITAKNEQSGAKLPPFMMQQASGRLLHMDQHQALAVWDHLVLVIWRGEVDVAAVQRLERAGMETLRRHPRGVALMGVVESTAVPPSAEMRKLSAASNDRMAKQGLVGIAGILSQKGFAGSVMRGVITGLTLISRAEHPFKVFENHTDGAVWLAKQLSQRGEHMGAVECGGVVGSYRSQYEQFYKRNLTPQ